MHDNSPDDPTETRRTQPPVQYASNVPPWLRKAGAEGHRIGVLLVAYRSRILDKDNLVGGGKPWIDALRYSGFIRNDTAVEIEAFYLQRKCRRDEEHTDIYLFEL